MKNILGICLLLSVLASGAYADEAMKSTEKNIHPGNWNVGGSFDYIHSTSPLDSTTTDTSFFGQYFVIERLSVGAQVQLQTETDTDSVFGAGPQATYHFYECGPFSAYGKLSTFFGFNDATIKSNLGGSLGTEYFITPSVAFGPSIFFRHIDRRTRGDYNRIGFEFSFGIYL